MLLQSLLYILSFLFHSFLFSLHYILDDFLRSFSRGSQSLVGVSNLYLDPSCEGFFPRNGYILFLIISIWFLFKFVYSFITWFCSCLMFSSSFIFWGILLYYYLQSLWCKFSRVVILLHGVFPYKLLIFQMGSLSSSDIIFHGSPNALGIVHVLTEDSFPFYHPKQRPLLSCSFPRQVDGISHTSISRFPALHRVLSCMGLRLCIKTSIPNIKSGGFKKLISELHSRLPAPKV